jgi:hypothetical protein
MPKQLPYDTSFAHAFQWRLDGDLDKALQLLNAQIDDQHDVQNCLMGNADYESIEYLLASNPSTPAEVLDHISQCVKCPKVLERIAGHPNAHPAILKRLAGSESSDVRTAVAENSNAEIEILRDLMADGNIDVRFCLAENPNVPTEILEELAVDDNPYVAYRAQSTLEKIGRKPAQLREMPVQQQHPHQQSPQHKRRAF